MSDQVVNAVGDFDIAGPDAASLRSFYAGVFGWRMDEQGPGYTLVETPEAQSVVRSWRPKRQG